MCSLALKNPFSDWRWKSHHLRRCRVWTSVEVLHSLNMAGGVSTFPALTSAFAFSFEKKKNKKKIKSPTAIKAPNVIFTIQDAQFVMSPTDIKCPALSKWMTVVMMGMRSRWNGTQSVTGWREAGDSSSLQTHWVRARLTRTRTLVPPLMWSLREVNMSHTCSAIYSKCSKWVSQPLAGQLAPCCQWEGLSGIHNQKTPNPQNTHTYSMLSIFSDILIENHWTRFCLYNIHT